MRKIYGMIFLLFVAVSCSDDDGSEMAEQVVVQGNDEVATQTLNLINNHRGSQTLASLTWNDEIAELALEHSANMASGQEEFGHNGFDDRIDRLAVTISFSGSAENVAFNEGADDPAAVAVDSWLNSPGHLANIEGDYDLTGIGVAEGSDGSFYFTQIFLRSN